MTREERRTHDLKRFQWFGIVHLDNVEEISMAVERLLQGSRFTVVEVKNYGADVSTVEVFPSQELTHSRGVEFFEGSDYLGFKISTNTHSWSFSTRIDGPRPGEAMDPDENRHYHKPFAKFLAREGPAFRWVGRTGDGAITVRVFALEKDDRIDDVMDVMYS